MTASLPSLPRRVRIAFASFRRALSDAAFAHRLATLDQDADLPPPPAQAPAQAPGAASPPMPERAASATPAQRPGGDASESALLLLGLLQREGRLIDFLQQDIHGYSDAEIGAAARLVHQGCQQVLRDHLDIQPVRDEPEGSAFTLEPGFDAASLRPSGRVIGEPPFSGTLVHRGWRVSATRLPQATPGHDPRILAAAEVEL
ncbi:MAG: DUF2760 domain-containing protein [Chromatiaceae bacterium]|nr:DUF2760 domain-containing protein [Chromatiaceae bacterium]